MQDAHPGPQWPADKIERRSVEKLIPYARNARTHSEAQVAQLAASIREWGWTVPILIDEAGGIIAGHGRVLAARLLEIPEVPVMIARGWTEAQKRAYVLADNQLALNAGWDTELLRIELGDLDADSFDLDLVGFDEAFLSQLCDDAVADPMGEWDGMPEFDQDDKTAHQTLKVHFAKDADVARFAELVGQTITDRTQSIWYPEAVIERYVDKVYEADDEDDGI